MNVATSAARALTLALLCTLAACGQKGPLYLPQASGEVVTRPTQTPAPGTAPATTPSSTDDKDAAPKPATPPPGNR